MIAVLLLSGGVALLYFGGEYLVRGATSIALLTRLSTAVIGLTVVAMGTSLPELAVSVGAAALGETDLAYGNIIGSNIFNVGAILAITTLLGDVVVKRQTVKIEYPFMLASAVVVVVLGLNGWIGRIEGLVFLTALVIFIAYIVTRSRRTPLAGEEARELEREVERAADGARSAGRAWGVNLVLVVVGVLGLVAGAELVVRGAVRIAVAVGVDGRVIGLTIVAMGTSLPELATSVVAARRGEQDIALANIVGSNMFNLLAILGTTATIVPVPIHPQATTDNWVMLSFCAVLFLPMYLEGKVSRRYGLLFMAGFIAYMTFVVATGS